MQSSRRVSASRVLLAILTVALIACAEASTAPDPKTIQGPKPSLDGLDDTLNCLNGWIISNGIVECIR